MQSKNKNNACINILSETTEDLIASFSKLGHKSDITV